jgi:hypothetical protein
MTVAIVAIGLQWYSSADASEPMRLMSRRQANGSCLNPFKARCFGQQFTNCRPAASPPDKAIPTTRTSFKFEPDDCEIILPVRIGAKEYPFVLDTGCTMSAFDTSLRPYLGQWIGTEEARDAFGNDVSLEMYTTPHAQIGSLPMRQDRVACFDFTGMREAAGRDICGFIGMDFLRNWIVTIDFDEGRVDFVPPGTAAKPEWGESIPFEYSERGMPRIRAAFGKDRAAYFEIDTGCDATGKLVDGLYLATLADLHEARVSGRELSMSMSGTSSRTVSRLSHLSVGAFQHDNLRFGSGPANILGFGYFSRYQVTFDFPNHQLYLAKGKRFDGKDHGPTTGLHTLFKTHGIVIEVVDEEGPAFAAGVRPNDILVELCGRPASALTQSKISELTKAGRRVTMTLERDGKRIQTSFIPYEFEDEPRPTEALAGSDRGGGISPACRAAVDRSVWARFPTQYRRFGALRRRPGR